MTQADFQQMADKRVAAILQDLTERFATNIWWNAVKPIVNLAKPALRRGLTEEPQEFKKWLEYAKTEIQACLDAYDKPGAP